MSALPSTSSQVRLPPISSLLGPEYLRDVRMPTISPTFSHVSLPPISFISFLPVVTTQPENSRIRQCNTCSSTRSCSWYNDPKDPTLDRCVNCYQRARAERTDKECARCHATSSMQWLKDPKDPTLDRCLNCYKRAQAKRTDRECATCHVNSSTQWYKDPRYPILDRCQKCYARALAERTDRECATCHVNSSNRWHKDPNNPALNSCAKCYRKCFNNTQKSKSNKKQKLEKPIPAENVSSDSNESTTQLGAPVFIPGSFLKDALKLYEAEKAGY